MGVLLVKSSKDIKIVVEIADQIWREHYIPIIGLGQVEYMLEKFQSEDAISQQIKDGYEYYLISFQDKKVGYLSIQKRENQLFLSKIYVLQKFRGKGIGKKAMEFVDERAKEMNCNIILLTVNKFNENSIKAYKKIGFIKIDEIVQDIGNGFVMDDFVFEKRISNEYSK